jgi:ZIP family zinc transporter
MDFSFQPVLLSLIAGLATGCGGLIVLAMGKVSDRVVSFSMGLASGVMLLVAFNSLFLEATKLLNHLELIVVFSIGALIMMALDLGLPHIELTTKTTMNQKTRIYNVGILIAIGITLHNFPEGLIVTAGYTYLPTLGLIVAISILLHNIPEGFATAIPLKAAGMKPAKIAAITFLSGLAEPVAALIGVFIFSLISTNSQIVVGSSLALAAGVMTYITADELIPVAHEYGYKHTVSVGLLLGIIFALLVDVIIG